MSDLRYIIWTDLTNERVRLADQPVPHWVTEDGRLIIARYQDERAADDFLRGRLAGQDAPGSIIPAKL